MGRKKQIFVLLILVLLFILYLNLDKIIFTFSMLSNANKTDISYSLEEEKVSDNNFKTELVNPLEEFSQNVENPEKTQKTTISEDTSEKSTSETDTINKKTESNYFGEEVLALEEIISKYNSKLVAVQNEFEQELESLVSEGYKRYKSDGASTSLAFEYINKGTNLEKKCDSKVYIIIDEFKDELNKYNYDTKIADEAAIYYKDLKNIKKNNLINKAKKSM